MNLLQKHVLEFSSTKEHPRTAGRRRPRADVTVAMRAAGWSVVALVWALVLVWLLA
jgi:hypothetical protein